MHTLDIIFTVACVFFIIIGIRRGLVGESFRLLALLTGFSAAFLFYTEASCYLHFNNRYAAHALSFVIIFIIAALLVLGIGWAIKKIIHLTPLGWIDYFFGGAIGLVKAVFIFWIICLTFASFPGTLKKTKVDHSLVFSTYERLPRTLKNDAILRLRDTLKKRFDHEVPAQLRKTEAQIEKLKNQVDSVKQTSHNGHHR
jgi:uncharacterized membrane protein required for colicin V production